MALIKIQDFTVTSAQASIDVTGMTDDYPTYYLKASNMKTDSSTYGHVGIQVLNGSTQATSGGFYYASYNLYIAGGGLAGGGSTADTFYFSNQIHTTNNGFCDAEFWLHGFGNSSAQPHFNFTEISNRRDNSGIYGRKGGFFYATTFGYDGVRFVSEVGANLTGNFSLYALAV
jgi:hypothetical protein